MVAEDPPQQPQGGQVPAPAGANNGGRRMPPSFFWLELLYLLALLGLFALYVASAGFRSLIPNPFGPLPLAVPWSGAVGAVTVGLFGIYFHNESWDNSYNYWYIARPLTGTVLGSFGYVIFVALIMT